MKTRKSTIIAIVLPIMVALLYMGLSARTGPFAKPSSAGLTAEQSSELWNQCDALFQQGEFEAALPGVLRLHRYYPGNHIYLERAAEIYSKLGRFDQEAAFWEQYFDRAPNPVTACPQIGHAYWKQGREKEAVSALERCLARDPENSDSIFFLAHALEKSGDANRAAELYQRGFKIAPDYTDLRIGLARVRLRQGKLAETRREIMSVLQKSPDDVDALLVAGLLYSRQGDLAKAKLYLERGVKLSDGYLDFHAALADIAEEEHRPAEAIRHYDRMLQEHPDDKRIREKRDLLARKQ